MKQLIALCILASMLTACGLPATPWEKREHVTSAPG